MTVDAFKEDAETSANSGDAEVTDALNVFRRRLGSLCKRFAGGGNVAKADISKKCK